MHQHTALSNPTTAAKYVLTKVQQRTITKMHLQHIDIRIIPILSHIHSASISLLPTIKYTYVFLLASHTLAAGSQRLPADVVLEPVPGYLPLAVWIAGVDFKAVLGIPPRVGVHFVEVEICGDEGGGEGEGGGEEGEVHCGGGDG